VDLSAIVVLWPGWIAIAILLRVALGGLDHKRIHDYVAARGGRVVALEWAPFATGWFGSNSERLYEICFEDRDGRRHEATCKTSLFSGVYFTEDRAV